MTIEEAKDYLECLANIIERDQGGIAKPAADSLRKIAIMIHEKNEEAESAWKMLEEMRLSDISNHADTVSKEIDKYIKAKRNIAKVSEA